MRLGAARCGSAWSTTASSRTRSAAPSAGIATSPSGSRRTATTVTYLTCASGRGEEPRRCRASTCDRRRAADASSTRAAGAGGSCRRSVFGLGVLLAPAAPRRPLRRRPHRLLPLLLAARRGRAAAAPLRRLRLVVDWHEVWAREYWREYLGPVGGRVGWLGAAALRARVRQRAFCFSRLHAERLRRGAAAPRSTVLEGEYARRARARREPRPAEPLVVFAGRHIPEKRVPGDRPGDRGGARERAAGAALRRSSATGPTAARSRARSPSSGSPTRCAMPAGAPAEEVARALARRALPAAALASARATAWSWSRRPSPGTPERGRRGTRQRRHRADRAGRQRRHRRVGRPPRCSAAAIVEVVRAGEAMRRSTADWYERHAERALDRELARGGRGRLRAAADPRINSLGLMPSPSLLAVVGARPNFVKMAPVLERLAANDDVSVRLAPHRPALRPGALGRLHRAARDAPPGRQPRGRLRHATPSRPRR